MDFILNGAGTGQVAQTLMNTNFDVGALRPFIGNDGRSYLTLNQGGKAKTVVINQPATLRKEDWIQLDEAIVRAARPRLRAVADLRGRGLQYVIPNGMGKTVLETERQSDVTPASVSMDGLRQGDADRPVFDLTNLPLPITHKDFHYSARQVMASRNGGSPLDTTGAELAGQRVAEMAEQLLLGTAADYRYGGGVVYGYSNFDGRITRTITSPEASGWTPPVTVQEILQMRLDSQEAFHYGPWVLYNSPAWDVYMDDDYSDQKGDNTLRDRIKKIEGIEDVRTLDFMTGFDLILVQMTADVARMVVGMDVTTVQWESQGGMQLNFKVMAILVPQIRQDINGRTGIVHGAPA